MASFAHASGSQAVPAPSALSGSQISPLSPAAALFHSILSSPTTTTNAAHELSRSSRKDLADKNIATAGYGEFTPETIIGLVEHIKEEGWGIKVPGGVVWDLGSGSGRGLFAAALAHDFETAVGVEYMPALHRTAMENLSIFEASQGARRRFEFRSEDITKFTTWKVTPEPTLLMCHATLFDNDLFACVQLMSEECETGTMFIMVSKELRTGSRTGIETLYSGQHQMTWGMGTVYIQRRT